MRVKICGITQIKQGLEIAALGANSLGFICVERSPRYIIPAKIRAIVECLPSQIDKVGVFADHSLREIAEVVSTAKLTAVQLHGAESPEFCVQLRQEMPNGIEIIKAFRIKTPDSLQDTTAYINYVNTLLLDAYHPQMLGGTGQTINWQDLVEFRPSLPWMLAGGLTPDNVAKALSRLKPDGIDLSSGVERSPGDKDLTKVERLFQALKA
ncbi:phosphoribosylanthranilate isomerase [Pleurocapsa sp. PCC 7319]|uniref:phosphoribosylanthranilate isomerase n=1 Tax=Pleurocapsa sp. PCC 7319 TaxID=118161 RepID=UPI00034B87BD|nr:phosphoribosylanthranilate isomerase [Pleurocapsa sp. PCC 7319]